MAEMLSKEGTERAATRSAERRAFRRAANAEQFRRAQQRLATLEARLESLDEAKLVARLGQIYEPAEIAFPPSVEAKREYDSVSHALANREILVSRRLQKHLGGYMAHELGTAEIRSFLDTAKTSDSLAAWLKVLQAWSAGNKGGSSAGRKIRKA